MVHTWVKLTTAWLQSLVIYSIQLYKAFSLEQKIIVTSNFIGQIGRIAIRNSFNRATDKK